MLERYSAVHSHRESFRSQIEAVQKVSGREGNAAMEKQAVHWRYGEHFAASDGRLHEV